MGKMKAKEVKKIALETIEDAMSAVYYKIADSEEYSDEEKEAIIKQINHYGERMLKTVGGHYYTA